MHPKFFENLQRFGIGFDPNFFERSNETPNFPPHNILKIDDDHYRLILAVAGFKESEIDIVLQDDVLTISGERAKEAPAHQVLYSGLAFRDFSRQFKLGEHVEVESASLQDGLLEINLLRRIPEAMKPRKIELNALPAISRKRLVA